MNKLCGVLFDGRDADRVILVYANLCNNLLFGKSLRAFLCLDQLLKKLDFADGLQSLYIAWFPFQNIARIAKAVQCHC